MSKLINQTHLNKVGITNNEFNSICKRCDVTYKLVPKYHGKGCIAMCNLRHTDIDEAIEVMRKLNNRKVVHKLLKLKSYGDIIPDTSDTFEVTTGCTLSWTNNFNARDKRVREKKKRQLSFLLKWREIQW